MANPVVPTRWTAPAVVGAMVGAMAGAGVWLTPLVARAHLELTSPHSRYGADVLKDGPCGDASNGPGGARTTFEPGQTIVVRWTEYIDHPGWFRIAFDDDGDDAFVDPADARDVWNTSAVLADEIADRAGGDYTYELTLPDIECDRCTLQVIQVMTDKTGNGWGNDEFYYQCADLRLSRDGSGGSDGGSTSAGTTGVGGSSGDGSNGDPPTGSAASTTDGGPSGTTGGAAPQDQTVTGCACASGPGSPTGGPVRWWIVAVAVGAARRPRSRVGLYRARGGHDRLRQCGSLASSSSPSSPPIPAAPIGAATRWRRQTAL